MEKNNRPYFSLLLILLALKMGVMLFVIVYSGIHLGPDEAQYWTWSRFLDWGYYSKPPGIAWEIFLGTTLFGQTELGVRAIPLLFGTALPLLIYQLSKYCNLSSASCFWSAIAITLSPLGVLSSFLAITDGGMILFWTASFVYLAAKIQKQQLPNYLLLGLLILGGGLFKWPIYLLWLIVLSGWLFFPHWTSMRIIPGILVSLGALLPSLYWNATHGWVTFRHVFATVSGGHGPTRSIWESVAHFFQFIGSQAALVSPILFFLMLLAIWSGLRQLRSSTPQLFFCAWTSALILCIGLACAPFMKLQGNWLIFAYPTAFILLGWYGTHHAHRWMKAGIGLSISACAFAFSIPAMQHYALFEGVPIPYRLNPFRHNIGWEQVGEALMEAGYRPEQDFLFGDKYQTASILSFYGPEQKRAYFFNLQQMRNNQFTFWPDMTQEQKGERGFFVVTENIPQLNRSSLIQNYETQLKPHFEAVKFLGIKTLFSTYGEISKGMLLFECQGYRGTSPPPSTLY